VGVMMQQLKHSLHKYIYFSWSISTTRIKYTVVTATASLAEVIIITICIVKNLQRGGRNMLCCITAASNMNHNKDCLENQAITQKLN